LKKIQLYFYQQILSLFNRISLAAVSFTLFHGLKKVTKNRPICFGQVSFAVPNNGQSKNSRANSLPRAAAVESSGQVVMWRDDVTYKEDGRQNINFLKIHETWKNRPAV
jgi:hypothetical protein